ncbi:hypothetical protein [Nocardia transvalensis]|nr:hypothetical protein [Nocardia transvalensis]MBF6328330.1 hypothetical protein [Nocardia transvalensis]
MTSRRARTDDPDNDPVEQPPTDPETPITMSHEEIEEYRAKLRAKYHEP